MIRGRRGQGGGRAGAGRGRQSGFSVTTITRRGRKMPFQVPSTQFHLPAAMEMCGVSLHCTEAGSGECIEEEAAGTQVKKKIKIIAGSKLKNGLFHKKVFNQVETKKRHKSDDQHDTHQHGAAQRPDSGLCHLLHRSRAMRCDSRASASARWMDDEVCAKWAKGEK